MLRPLLLPTLAITLLGGANWAEAWNWWRGEDAYHNEKYAESAEAFAEGLTGELSPAQSKLAYNEGTARYAAKEWATAEQAFQKAAEADPNNWRANYNKGNAQVEQGYVDGTVTDPEKLKGAIASYEAALEVEPNDEDTKHNLEYVKKLLEEHEKQQEQQQQQNDDQKSDDQQQQDQEQQGEEDENKDSEQEGENEEKDSDSEDGDKESEEQKDSGEQDDQQESGDQEREQSQQQQPQQNNGGQQQQQPRPDLQYSQEILDNLAQMEANIQYNRALARDQANGDPLQQLLDQLMDPTGSTLGAGTERRRAHSDEVDW